jgi:hypothetical protein
MIHMYSSLGRSGSVQDRADLPRELNKRLFLRLRQFCLLRGGSLVAAYLLSPLTVEGDQLHCETALFQRLSRELARRAAIYCQLRRGAPPVHDSNQVARRRDILDFSRPLCAQYIASLHRDHAPPRDPDDLDQHWFLRRLVHRPSPWGHAV